MFESLLSSRFGIRALILALVLSAGLSFSIFSISREVALPEIKGRTMGTTYSVKFGSHPGSIDSSDLAARTEQLLEDLNQKMSTYRASSELMRFNSSATTDWVPISNDLFRVLEESLVWSRKTGGAFDISVGALVDLWGFGPAASAFVTPPDSKIADALVKVGYGLLELRSSPAAIRKKHPLVSLDLSATAKGYAVDRVGELLLKSGPENLLVEIGGELKGIGERSPGQPWTIAIEDPAGGPPLLRIRLNGKAVATSGIYRQFIRQRGRRLSHLLDPRTGRPILHSLVSVSVVHDSAMSADALATALMALGPGPARRFAEEENLAALFWETQGKTLKPHYTRRFENYLVGEKLR